MTDEERQMTNEWRSTNDAVVQPPADTVPDFGFGHWDFFRHSTFVISHSIPWPAPKRSAAFHHALEFLEDRGQFGFGLGGALAVKGVQADGPNPGLKFVAQWRRAV